MSNIILFDDENWDALLPLSLTKPICELRVGILTIKEKWEIHLDGKASYITQDYLSDKYPINISSDNLVINSRWLPNTKLLSLIKGLALNDALLFGDTLVASRMDNLQFERLIENKDIEELKGIDLSNKERSFSVLKRPNDIFEYNGQEISEDINIITKKRSSQKIPASVNVIGDGLLFIEEGAQIHYCSLNTSNGPIYIGKDSEIMEGSLIRGPFALCNNAVVKMGAKIYGNTTIGPYSKAGGEINTAVFQAFSNKSHDGYLGHSVLGEWCNIGAGATSSNLKNNYSEVKLWNYNKNSFENTGSQFCGLIMGDHSKAGINTMFNTGTVVGVSSNVFGAGFPKNFIPSFSWGGSSGYKTYTLEKSLETARIVMARRSKTLTKQDELILEHVFHKTSSYRNWEI